MEVLTGDLNLSPRERLQAVKDATVRYLDRSPSDPESVISVARYCLDGVDLFASTISASYAHYHPDRELDLRTKLAELSDTPESYGQGHDSEEKFVLDGNQITFERPPHPKSRRTQPTLSSFRGIPSKAGYIDRRLPRLEYAELLDQARPSKDPAIRRFGNPERGRYQVYNWRFFLFLGQSELDIKAPEAELMALAFLEDIAKKKAMWSIRDQLRLLDPYSQSSFTIPPDEVDQAVKFVGRKVDPTYHHLGYLDLIKESEAKIRSVTHFDEDKHQLLKDIAFLRKGDLDSGDLAGLLEPISRLIGQKDYLRATECRNFVLDNFAASTPAWRREDFGSSRSYYGVSALAQERYGQPEPLQGIPEEYTELISVGFQVLDQKAEKSKLNDAEKAEKIRQEVVASELLFESIKNASFRQSKELGRWDFNPDAPIENKNPIILNCRLEIRNLDIISPTGDNAYTDVIRDSNGEISQLQHARPNDRFGFYAMATHYLTVVFNNLLYQRILEKEDVEVAYQRLAEQNKIAESDSPVGLLSTGLKSSLKVLLQRGHQADVSDPGQVTSLRKAGMIEDLIQSFE